MVRTLDAARFYLAQVVHVVTSNHIKLALFGCRIPRAECVLACRKLSGAKAQGVNFLSLLSESSKFTTVDGSSWYPTGQHQVMSGHVSSTSLHLPHKHMAYRSLSWAHLELKCCVWNNSLFFWYLVLVSAINMEGRNS